MNTRILRRLPFVLALGVAPALALAWGCGDDDTVPSGGRVYVDPGGTWGAEVTVTVIGRGRISTAGPGVDCPSGSCFAKYVFPSNAADGATGGLQLTATPTPGANFLGWTFEAASIGAQGRGGEGCNPIMRATTQPSGITAEPTITLPFGEVDGTAPAGKSCAGFTKVPLAYQVTARFDAELPPIDAGYDAGADEILYQAPTGATAAEGLGLTNGGALYWKYSNAGNDSIAYGSSPSSSIPGQSPLTVTTASEIQNFHVTRFGVVYTNDQNIFAIRSTNPTNPVSVGTMTTIGTCRGFAMDSSSNVYCRTATTLVRWQTQGSTAYAAPVTIYGSGVPTGDDVAVDTSSGPAYLDTSTGIGSLSILTGDFDGGPAPTPVAIISGRTGIQSFRSGTGGFAWTESGSGIFTTQSKTAGATVATSTANTGTIFTLAQDQGSSTSWIAAGSNGIFLAPLGSPATTFRAGNQFTSAAASSQYIFWTTSLDGHVHRARRF